MRQIASGLLTLLFMLSLLVPRQTAHSFVEGRQEELADEEAVTAEPAQVSAVSEKHHRKEAVHQSPLHVRDAGSSRPQEIEHRFTQIYAHHVWGDAGGGSGDGSSRRATIVTQSIIRTVANKYNLRSLLDAPCGAMAWQPLLLRQLAEDFPDFRYMGVDVVQPVIQANKAKFENTSNWQFEAMDVSKDRLPVGFDLLLSRDALQHLPCEVAVDVLANYAASEAKYLLLGSYEHGTQNKRIETGDYYDINLRLPPFDLRSVVLASYSEHTHLLLNGDTPTKYLLLFSGPDLKSRDFAAMRQGCKELRRI